LFLCYCSPYFANVSCRLILTSPLYGFSSLFIFWYVFYSSDCQSLVCYNHTLLILEWPISMFSNPFVRLTYTILVGSSISASRKRFGPSPMEEDNRVTKRERIAES
jgi:hypothetical protein